MPVSANHKVSDALLATNLDAEDDQPQAREPRHGREREQVHLPEPATRHLHFQQENHDKHRLREDAQALRRLEHQKRESRLQNSRN